MDSDDIKYMAKKVLRMIFAGKKAKIILIIVLILLLILFMLLPASFYFITIDDGIWDDDEKGKPSNYTDSAKISTDATKMGIVVDKDTMVKNGLKDLGYDDEKIANMTDEDIIEAFKINKKLKKDPPITSLDELTQAELLWCLNDAYSSYLKKPEELEKLLNAELITQYPDLGSNATELNGIIKFERHKDDDSSEFLTYLDYSTFTGYVDSNNTDALKYFTLDEQGNALVAYSDKTTETLTSNDGDMKLSDYTDGLDDSNKQPDGDYSKTTITVSSVSINYKSAVEKYTMPFNYLWSLLVIGEDKDFVLELADLVENSEITISIYDNIVTTEDVNTYTYKKETRTDKYARLSVRNASGVSGYPTERYWSAEDSPSGNYDPRYQASYNTDSTVYSVIHTVTNERNQIKYDLTKADVWIVDYSKGYDFPKDATSTSEPSETVELDDTAYTLNTETSVKGDAAANDPDILAFKQTVENFVKKKVGNSSTSRSGTGSGSKTSVTENKSSGSGNKSSGSGTAPIGGSTSGANSNSNSEEVEAVVVDAELKNYDHFVERKHTQTVTTTDKTYVAQTPVNNPKDDKNADTDNFVKILCKESHVEAKSYLTDGKTTSWLWEIMEKNCPDYYIDLTKYLFNKVTNSTRFGEFEENFLESLYGNSSSNSWVTVAAGDINVSDETMFITDVETLKKAFTGYSNSAKLVQNAQYFLDMQSKYKVNALFAAAVSITETGAGNAGNAVKVATSSNSVGARNGQCWNNWFNIKGKTDNGYGIVNNGEGTSYYRIYNTVGESVDNFGNNIANGSYYYKAGKYTVTDIGHTYCPNSSAYPTQGDDWGKTTLQYMYNFYAAAGITMNSTSNGSFVQYYQGDYANVPYGDGTIANNGCGPTAFAMIASTLKGQSITPKDAVEWCKNRYYINGSGTSWAYFNAAATHFQLNVNVVQKSNINDAVEALKNGKYVISSQGPGLFTRGGHYIVLAGIDSAGNITVKDPNKNNAVNKGYNNRTFTVSEISRAAKQYWIFN